MVQRKWDPPRSIFSTWKQREGRRFPLRPRGIFIYSLVYHISFLLQDSGKGDSRGAWNHPCTGDHLMACSAWRKYLHIERFLVFISLCRLWCYPKVSLPTVLLKIYKVSLVKMILTFSLLNFVLFIQSLDFRSMRSINWRRRLRLTHRNVGATQARDGVWISLIEAGLGPNFQTSTEAFLFFFIWHSTPCKYENPDFVRLREHQFSSMWIPSADRDVVSIIWKVT